MRLIIPKESPKLYYLSCKKLRLNRIYILVSSSLIKVFTVFIFLFSQILIINAQVKIKEKIKIKPEVNMLIESNLKKTFDSGHSLKAVHMWDQTYLGENNDIPMSRMRFRIKTNFCSQIVYSDFDYSGNLEYTLTDLMGTSYTIELLLSQRTAWDPVYRGEYLHGGGFQVYVDGEYVTTGHNSTFVEPWFGYFGIDIAGSKIYYNEDAINVYPNTNKSCSPILGNLYKDWPTVTIISGQEYLSFYDETNDDTLGNSYYFGDFALDGIVPKMIYDEPYLKDEPIPGIVKAEVNGIEVFDTVQIIKAADLELNVQIIPQEISPNELANIFLKELSDDELIEFGTDQLFDVEIIAGADYGTILSSNGIDKSDSFTQIEQGFKFLAASETDVDSAEVLIKVSAKIIADQEVMSKVNNNSIIQEGREETDIAITKNEDEISDEPHDPPEHESFIFIPPDEDREIFGVGRVKITKDIFEIMLGDTKYFGIKKKIDEEVYKIEEIKTIYGEQPLLSDNTNLDWKWLKTDVWGNEPIEKIGFKSGVYWEKKWFDKSDNKNKDFAEDGIIRVIGRYWEEEQEDNYIAKLGGIFGKDIKIKVIKPKELLSDGQLLNYGKARNVFNEEYSIDEECIKYGGIYGIPPQMIKGQMFTESATKLFKFSDGTSDLGFTPSYLYEPFSTQFSSNVRKLVREMNNFVVSENSMGVFGAAAVPNTAEHQHLQPVHYFENQKSVWEIVEANSQLTDEDNTRTTYGYRYKDGYRKGRINFYSYSKPKEEFNSQLNKAHLEIRKKYKIKPKNKFSLTQHEEANDLAREAVINFIQNEWEIDGTSGLANIIAQTRIAASYGLLQSLYTTAVFNSKYPTSMNNNPEKLSIVTTGLNYALENLKLLFERYNKIALDESNSWKSKRLRFPTPNAGFEEALNVMFHKWNPSKKDEFKEPNYHKLVLNNSQKFLPRR